MNEKELLDDGIAKLLQAAGIPPASVAEAPALLRFCEREDARLRECAAVLVELNRFATFVHQTRCIRQIVKTLVSTAQDVVTKSYVLAQIDTSLEKMLEMFMEKRAVVDKSTPIENNDKTASVKTPMQTPKEIDDERFDRQVEKQLAMNLKVQR